MGIYYIDGEYVDEKDALLPVTDLAVLRGYGVFDFTRTYGGVPFKLAEHLTRLRRSAEWIDLPLALTDDEISGIVTQTVKRNGYPEAAVRIVVTGGESANGIMPANKPRLLVLVTPLRPVNPESYRYGSRSSRAVDLPARSQDPTISPIKAHAGAARRSARKAVSSTSRSLAEARPQHFRVLGDTLVSGVASSRHHSRVVIEARGRLSR